MKNGILSLSIKEKTSLHAAYMPFLNNGGLFIPTTKSYQLGEEIFILVQLPEQTDKLPIAGKVAWVTPSGANKSQGVGIQFSDSGPRQIIDKLLLGIDPERPTHTM